jgi:hypothetical protein
VSDIARVYAPGTEPELVAGTAVSNAAGAGQVAVNGKEKATVANSSLVHPQPNGFELAR